MKLIRTEFSKFKSIVGESLDIERDVTCLVGINVAGKSNVLKALLKVDTSEKISEDDFSRHDSAFGSEDASPEIKLTFVPNDEDEKEDLSKIFGHEVTLVVMSKDSSGYRLNYPSIDHTVPVSKGGTHTWDNVQLAHFYCNRVKGNNIKKIS